MITLTLDHHEFLYAIEGFARGSHLRQHVWEQIVYKSIPQLTDDEIDFLWFMLRRNLWECYFYEIHGEQQKHVGHSDYLHALAALHRGNRYKVKFRIPAEPGLHTAICYRFGNHFRPLYKGNRRQRVESFNAFIPDEWVKLYQHLPAPRNRYVEQGKEDWWDNIGIYNNSQYFE